MNAIETEARAIAAANPSLGVDPTMIMFAIQFLMDCFKRTEDGDVKSFAEDHYDETTDKFDSHLVKRCRPQARRAARKAGSRSLSKPELDAITVASLRRALDADEGVVAACMAAMPVEDGE